MYGMFVLGLKYKKDKVCLVQQMEGMAGVCSKQSRLSFIFDHH